jgi:CheY-like chemotaxis protein
MEYSDRSAIVFMVDDSPEFAYLIDRYCETCGCQVWHFRTTGDALAQLEEDLPNVLLLNMMLLVDDRSKLIQKIKNGKRFKNVSIIVFSSLRLENITRPEGVDYFLLKPFLYVDFLAALQATGVLHPAD